MIQEGKVVLFGFPQAEPIPGKIRPALVIRKIPGPYDDWLICMISSQLSQQIAGFDDVVKENDLDFKPSGLKLPSVIRIGRLAVVNSRILFGSIGSIADERLKNIKNRLSEWINAV